MQDWPLVRRKLISWRPALLEARSWGGLRVTAPAEVMFLSKATAPSLPQFPHSRAGGGDMTPTRCYSNLPEQRERRGAVNPYSKHPRYEPHGQQRSCSAELIPGNLSRNQIIGYIPSQPPSPGPHGHVYSSSSQQSTFQLLGYNRRATGSAQHLHRQLHGAAMGEGAPKPSWDLLP